MHPRSVSLWLSTRETPIDGQDSSMWKQAAHVSSKPLLGSYDTEGTDGTATISTTDRRARDGSAKPLGEGTDAH